MDRVRGAGADSREVRISRVRAIAARPRHGVATGALCVDPADLAWGGIRRRPDPAVASESRRPELAGRRALADESLAARAVATARGGAAPELHRFVAGGFRRSAAIHALDCRVRLA